MRNPLVFSTLACPQWPIGAVVANARAFGYDGIEWRGGPQGHINPGATTAALSTIRQAMHDAGLFSLGITAYTSFVSADACIRQDNIDELRRYVDLAEAIGAQYVRAFPGELPPGTHPDESTLSHMVDSLQIAAEYAARAGVRIALEPHDDFVRSASVAPILRQATNPALTVIWDVGNTYGAGEEYLEGAFLLAERLAYVHLKDGRGREEAWRLCRMGDGDVPLGDILNLLVGAGYEGALCVEWEWAWHPELDPPEIALPHAAGVIRSLLASIQPETPIIH